MSITLSNIEVRKVKKGDVTSYECRLVLKNENIITDRQMNGIDDTEEFDKRIMQDLRMSILAHIYGDFIEPVNELGTLAGHYMNTECDRKELDETREKIRDLINGVEPKQKEKSPIIM